MTMSPARRLSSALQGGFFSKSRVPVVTSSVRLPINVALLGFRTLIMEICTCRANARSRGIFYICHPDHVSKSSIKETGILRSKSHYLPQARNHQSAPKNHPIMAGHRSSSSRSRSVKPGDWVKCTISHGRLVELQTQGFLPPAYMVPVRVGLATYNGGEQAESFPNPSRGSGYALSLTC